MGAVLMLSRAAATELATVGIRVNSVKPGPTVTNLTATWGPERDKDGNITTIEDIAQRILSQIPVGQMAQPREIASVIAFLACDASQYITGSEFVVDGGYTAV